MYQHLDDEFNFTYKKDNTYQRELRELSLLPDRDRPTSERFLEQFYASLSDDKPPTNRVLPHSDLFYCRAALEAQFPDRKFTIDEIKELISEVYDIDY